MGRLRDHFDEFGNPKGLAFDLGGGDEQRMRDEKILLYTPFNTAQYHGSHLIAAVAERNISMDIVSAGSQLDETTLSRYTQLWYVSGTAPTLSSHQIDLIADFVKRGNGLAIWADNDPFYADANLLAERLIGTRFSGDKMADQIMTPWDQVAPGHFIEHQLTHGVNNLYEGVTICTIRPVEGLTILGQSHDGQLNIACFERGQERIVLDTGFTKLYNGYFQRAAGTARYLRNIAFWLARGSRGVEYRLFTPGRGKLATVVPGSASEPYRQTVTQPVTLTYILSWNDEASLRLSVRDPRGQITRDETTQSSPLRVEVRATTPGEWTAQVTGVRSAQPDVAYVLTLAVDSGTAQPAQQFTPASVYLPVHLIVDGSRHVLKHTAALMAGVHELTAKLRQRTSHGAGAQVSLIAADGGGKEVIAPVDARAFTARQLGAIGSCSLGAALNRVVPRLSSASGAVRPLVVILLAGPPEDNWSSAADQLHRLAARGSVDVIAVGIGGYNDAQVLRQLTTAAPLTLDALTYESVRALFGWIYEIADAAMTGLESGGRKASAPTPPAGVRALA
jgi:uncharacterized protein YegL